MKARLKNCALFISVILILTMMMTGCSTGTTGTTSESTSGKAQAFKAGKYSAKAQGKDGEVAVDVTFSANKIEKIDIVKQSETPGLGDKALEKVSGEIVATQSLAVDTVTGATSSSNAMINAVTDAVKQAGGDVDRLKTKAAK